MTKQVTATIVSDHGTEVYYADEKYFVTFSLGEVAEVLRPDCRAIRSDSKLYRVLVEAARAARHRQETIGWNVSTI